MAPEKRDEQSRGYLECLAKTMISSLSAGTLQAVNQLPGVRVGRGSCLQHLRAAIPVEPNQRDWLLELQDRGSQLAWGLASWESARLGAFPERLHLEWKHQREAGAVYYVPCLAAWRWAGQGRLGEEPNIQLGQGRRDRKLIPPIQDATPFVRAYIPLYCIHLCDIEFRQVYPIRLPTRSLTRTGRSKSSIVTSRRTAGTSMLQRLDAVDDSLPILIPYKFRAYHLESIDCQGSSWLDGGRGPGTAELRQRSNLGTLTNGQATKQRSNHATITPMDTLNSVVRRQLGIAAHDLTNAHFTSPWPVSFAATTMRNMPWYNSFPSDSYKERGVGNQSNASCASSTKLAMAYSLAVDFAAVLAAISKTGSVPGDLYRPNANNSTTLSTRTCAKRIMHPRAKASFYQTPRRRIHSHASSFRSCNEERCRSSTARLRSSEENYCYTVHVNATQTN
ncbi:uncharacterized protein CLUP02_05358 [Colletotrichum lupini]|uniref:Uncharacterized protein n=1 Tax=Colletotrichum lupini TaxID=145971 RepID=A0A9Q8SNV0_9PEZI|nr:uncharacterized protein CLUP02_05358 [Colletotrichum lupini]UQC79877.1 hypothetical protein CLUP02_05358 [Colletotrichum lupini]